MKKQRNNHKQNTRFYDVDSLKQQIEKETPKSGEYLYDYKLKQALKDRNLYVDEEFKKLFKIDFEDLPLSKSTLKALQSRKFIKMTEIQRCALPHALGGRDILGASRTGSGKTLSYLIPLIERLYLNCWTPYDGVGGLIILPTRELAIQVFEVFKSITDHHVLSVGLLIGGKNYDYEKDRVSLMNVLVCTPGRLLQHMEESPGFHLDNLQVLVLDEADMILEMGFWDAMRAILQYIPRERQTILFSATLSQNIHQLSQLSLKNPETILLHNTDDSKYETPSKLSHYYMVLQIHQKIDVLFSFLKTHLKSKVLIFLSSCKQVRFIYEAFRKLKVGLPLFELHGRQKQQKRTAIYFSFMEKKYGALFTTNIASRGLDFPKIDWVIQFDCPDDVQTYIHRVGRTARYKQGGSALLFLLEAEQRMANKIKARGVDLVQKYVNTQKQTTIRRSLQSLLSENIEIKYLAQRAFISYMRSIHLSPDKEVFDVQKINANDLAESLGLIQIPVIQFVKREEIEQEEEQPRQLKRTKLQKLKEKIELKKQSKILDDSLKPMEVARIKTITRKSDLDKFDPMKHQNYQRNDDLIGGLLIPKQKQPAEAEELEKPQLIVSKNQLKKVKLDGHFGGRNKTFFDNQGKPITETEMRQRQLLAQQKEIIEKDVDFTQQFMLRLDQHADQDKAKEMLRRKQKRIKRKQLLREEQHGDDEEQEEEE